MTKRPILGLTAEITIFASNKKDAPTKTVIARIDTGATISSIDIDLAGKLQIGPIIREKLVKSASGKKRRPVVRAIAKIQGNNIEGEFSLADRKAMKYPVLIGQNHLKQGTFLVDPLID
ncbi:hypothetical protein HOA92_01170 [archaeon]|jgi:hypothetical protein|nr:hypothetical protein [archaeon]MBT6761629.1 hypothetical protein [archaeon]